MILGHDISFDEILTKFSINEKLYIQAIFYHHKNQHYILEILIYVQMYLVHMEHPFGNQT
jgi:hypothetical protein